MQAAARVAAILYRLVPAVTYVTYCYLSLLPVAGGQVQVAARDAAILHQPVACPAHPADWEIYQLPPPVVGLILGLPDCARLI